MGCSCASLLSVPTYESGDQNSTIMLRSTEFHTMTKPISSELIEQILTQQKINKEKYMQWLYVSFNNEKAIKQSFLHSLWLNVKKFFVVKDPFDNTPLLRMRIQYSISVWDWSEDPYNCLIGIGEDPNNFDLDDLYKQVSIAYKDRK
jgi:hypothetical protein